MSRQARRSPIRQRSNARTLGSVEVGRLKASFIFEKDEVYPDRGWYTHKSQTTTNSWNRNYLDAPVNATGYTYLRSHFHGDSWMFHTKLIVRIGDRVIESQEVPSYDDSNDRENSAGSVWETISYTKDRDNGILGWLAGAPDTVKIVVRYTGDQYRKDYTLTKRDLAAIKESYRLAAALKRLAE